MATVNLSLTRRITGVLDSYMHAQLASLASTSACAGIRNNESAAKKARVNHHGAPATRVPARRFINAATMSLDGLDLAAELKKTIQEQIKGPVGRSQEKYSITRAQATRTYVIQRRGSVFGERADGTRHGPAMVMRKIADKLAENQKLAISEHKFAPGPTNGGDPASNAASVVKRKGSNAPLIDSGDMYKSIKGWIENAG